MYPLALKEIIVALNIWWNRWHLGVQFPQPMVEQYLIILIVIFALFGLRRLVNEVLGSCSAESRIMISLQSLWIKHHPLQGHVPFSLLLDLVLSEDLSSHKHMCQEFHNSRGFFYYSIAATVIGGRERW